MLLPNVWVQGLGFVAGEILCGVDHTKYKLVISMPQFAKQRMHGVGTVVQDPTMWAPENKSPVEALAIQANPGSLHHQRCPPGSL